MKKIDIPKFEKNMSINFFFQFDDKRGNKTIVLEDLICGYDNFQTPSLNLVIDFGTKLQILGKNGTGKTTLINTILKFQKPLSGKMIVGSDAKIGYISQDTLISNQEDTILDFLIKDTDNYDLSFIFTLLDKFNISYDDRNKKYNSLSPGERTRVNLAKIALNKINILILDEVTNHLDKSALDLIYELIRTYEGTIISISHNRKYNEILNPDMILDISNGLIMKNDK